MSTQGDETEVEQEGTVAEGNKNIEQAPENAENNDNNNAEVGDESEKQGEDVNTDINEESNTDDIEDGNQNTENDSEEKKEVVNEEENENNNAAAAEDDGKVDEETSDDKKEETDVSNETKPEEIEGDTEDVEKIESADADAEKAKDGEAEPGEENNLAEKTEESEEKVEDEKMSEDKPSSPIEKPSSPTEKPSSPAEKPSSPTEKLQSPLADKPSTPERTPTPNDKPESQKRTPTPTDKPGTPKRTPTPSDKSGTPKRTPTPTDKPATPKNRTPSPKDVPQAPPPPPLAERTATSIYTEDPGPNVMNMVWSFGMNRNVPVLNVTTDGERTIMYVCAHTGVIYSAESNTQVLLRGHSNAITCTCVSADKRWLATADKGKDNMVIIWDTASGVPVRTMFEPHPAGVVAMAITPNAKYLATISADDEQTVSIWDWTNGEEEPMCSIQLQKSFGTQNYILFNPDDSTQLVSNSESQVIFYSWKSSKLEFVAPPLTDRDFNKPVGRYSQSVFLKNSTRALTATSLGTLVVWEVDKNYGAERDIDKKALKLLRFQERAINVLTTTDSLIVAGDVTGHIKFFDQTLKLINWYQDWNLGPICAISFAHTVGFEPASKEGTEYPPDATIKAKEFVIRDFVVGTSNSIYAHVTTDGTVVDVIHRDHDAALHALCTHPSRPIIAVGSYSGLLKLWDYDSRRPVATRYFDRGSHIRCCEFDPKGQFLAVGFTNGSLRVLDAFTLSDQVEEPFRYSKDAITHLAFSHDSQFLASADADFTTSLYKATSNNEGDAFVYLGRYRAHYKAIREVLFCTQLDSGLPRLLTLGEDRVLVEYDMEKSCKDNLVVLHSDRIEQSGVPLCMALYPPITKEQFICTANDQFKFKLYNSTTKMCRRTLLGPTYGSPLQKIKVLPTTDEVHDKRYMAYITKDKVGLISLPLDGNPHNAMALIAHPGGVSNLAVSYDGTFVFTAGGPDCAVHMWCTNFPALTIQSSLGGEDLIPFYGLLDGGRDGELFAELEDYFYYAQLRSQGINTMETRSASTAIQISEIPFVMRAMGFYPSEQEVLDMLNEIKYSKYVETGDFVNEIDLGTFIKLYVNHRPAFGLSQERLKWAFDILGIPTDNGSAIDRGELLDLLQSRGEHITEYELAEFLTTLLGFNAEGGSSELQDFDPALAADVIDENLPHSVTAEMFSNELLGFSMYADVLNVMSEQTIET